MPNPVQSDLHVNRPLTGLSIAYIQRADTYIADKIFKTVPVNNRSDMYWKYSKSDWRRTDVARRAPGTESKGVGWRMESDTFYCHVYAVHKDIDDQDRANADSNFNLDRDATEFITNQSLLKRDIDWTNAFFVSGVWATEYTGVATNPGTGQFLQWDQASSDPINDVAEQVIKFRQLTGFAPNVGVMGAYVMKALKNHPDLIDRIKYTQRGIVSEDLIATVFDLDELYVNYATVASGPELNDAAQQDAAATYDFISDPTSFLLAYVPPNPGLMTPAAGYTFAWKGYLGGNAKGIRVKRFRMENLSSDRIEAEMTYSMKVVCPDLGIFINSAVATPV